MAEPIKHDFKVRCVLSGHQDHVTALASPDNGIPSNLLLSSSRDKKVIVWEIKVFDEVEGKARRSLTGHSQCVQDLAISLDGHYALTGSWDKTLRLWDLNTGITMRSFVGHTKDVNSVAFSENNRQIISSGRDMTIKMWNTLAQCKSDVQSEHTDWISCVRFSPCSPNHVVVSSSWDSHVLVRSFLDFSLTHDLHQHRSAVYTLAVSPDGSLCASGGKDKVAMLWDVGNGLLLYRLDCGSVINALCFSPRHYWLCVGTDKSIQIWNLEKKIKIADITSDSLLGDKPSFCGCTSLKWFAGGEILFAGMKNGDIVAYTDAGKEVSQV